MKKEEIVTLCIKLLAINYLVTGANNFPFIVSAFKSLNMPWEFTAIPVLYLALSALLFFKAGWLTRFIINVDQDKVIELKFTPTNKIVCAALQILGFYFIAKGIPEFFLSAARQFGYFFKLLPQPEALEGKHILFMIGPITTISVGLWFIFGSGAIVYYVEKVRRRAQNYH